VRALAWIRKLENYGGSSLAAGMATYVG